MSNQAYPFNGYGAFGPGTGVPMGKSTFNQSQQYNQQPQQINNMSHMPAAAAPTYNYSSNAQHVRFAQHTEASRQNQLRIEEDRRRGIRYDPFANPEPPQRSTATQMANGQNVSQMAASTTHSFFGPVNFTANNNVYGGHFVHGFQPQQQNNNNFGLNQQYAVNAPNHAGSQSAMQQTGEQMLSIPQLFNENKHAFPTNGPDYDPRLFEDIKMPTSAPFSQNNNTNAANGTDTGEQQPDQSRLPPTEPIDQNGNELTTNGSYTFEQHFNQNMPQATEPSILYGDFFPNIDTNTEDLPNHTPQQWANMGHQGPHHEFGDFLAAPPFSNGTIGGTNVPNFWTQGNTIEPATVVDPADAATPLDGPGSSADPFVIEDHSPQQQPVQPVQAAVETAAVVPSPADSSSAATSSKPASSKNQKPKFVLKCVLEMDARGRGLRKFIDSKGELQQGMKCWYNAEVAYGTFEKTDKIEIVDGVQGLYAPGAIKSWWEIVAKLDPKRNEGGAALNGVIDVEKERKDRANAKRRENRAAGKRLRESTDDTEGNTPAPPKRARKTTSESPAPGPGDVAPKWAAFPKDSAAYKAAFAAENKKRTRDEAAGGEDSAAKRSKTQHNKKSSSTKRVDSGLESGSSSPANTTNAAVPPTSATPPNAEDAAAAAAAEYDAAFDAALQEGWDEARVGEEIDEEADAPIAQPKAATKKPRALREPRDPSKPKAPRKTKQKANPTAPDVRPSIEVEDPDEAGITAAEKRRRERKAAQARNAEKKKAIKTREGNVEEEERERRIRAAPTQWEPIKPVTMTCEHPVPEDKDVADNDAAVNDAAVDNAAENDATDKDTEEKESQLSAGPVSDEEADEVLESSILRYLNDDDSDDEDNASSGELIFEDGKTPFQLRAEEKARLEGIEVEEAEALLEAEMAAARAENGGLDENEWAFVHQQCASKDEDDDESGAEEDEALVEEEAVVEEPDAPEEVEASDSDNDSEESEAE